MIEITFFLWSYFWVFVGSGLIFFSPIWIPWVLRLLGFNLPKASQPQDALEAMTKLTSTMKPYVVFYYNAEGTDLSVKDKTTLKTWVLQGRGSGAFLIRAHSDQTGPAVNRKKIAKKRGDLVQGLLQSWGVEPEHIKMENCEDKDLAHPTIAARNRRVEVFFIS